MDLNLQILSVGDIFLTNIFHAKIHDLSNPKCVTWHKKIVLDHEIV